MRSLSGTSKGRRGCGFLPLVVVSVAGALYLHFPTASADEEPVVTTSRGAIRGTWMQTEKGRKAEAFLAIPFAKPPVGPLRFKNPEPSEPWTGTRDGTKEPNQCPQINEVTHDPTDIVGNEDCLYLNVYTPSSTEKRKYPVMLFIHGGGFTFGACLSKYYGPDKLLAKDVILVTTNYRLGILGFGSTEDEVITGNFGLKDQALALKWVKENIAAFGGDDENISVFGQSAGGASAHFQALAPQNSGLIKRVMPMSGSVDCGWAMAPPGYVAEQTRKAGEIVNCSTSSSKELVDCLRKVPASIFPSLLYKFSVWDGSDPAVVFSPIFEQDGVGDSFITKKSFQQRSSFPMMTGVTAEEGAFKIALMKLAKKGFENILSEYDKRFTEITPVALFFNASDPNPLETAEKIKNYFFGSNAVGPETLNSFMDLFTDGFFLQGVADSIRKHNGSAFVYKFAFQGSYSLTQTLTRSNFTLGTTHGDDLMYLFPIKNWVVFRTKITKKDEEMTNLMVDLFTNFATNGNPTPEGKPIEWNPVTLPNMDFFSIKNDELKMEKNFPTKRDEFWQTLTWRKNLIPSA